MDLLQSVDPTSSSNSGSDAYRPSFFELAAQEQLRDLLQPALRYVLAVLAQRNPRYLLRIVNRFDEVYALCMFMVERHYLKTWGALSPLPGFPHTLTLPHDAQAHPSPRTSTACAAVADPDSQPHAARRSAQHRRAPRWRATKRYGRARSTPPSSSSSLRPTSRASCTTCGRR